jgi:hypothetical protein
MVGACVVTGVLQALIIRSARSGSKNLVNIYRAYLIACYIRDRLASLKLSNKIGLWDAKYLCCDGNQRLLLPTHHPATWAIAASAIRSAC